MKPRLLALFLLIYWNVSAQTIAKKYPVDSAFIEQKEKRLMAALFVFLKMGTTGLLAAAIFLYIYLPALFKNLLHHLFIHST
jgi:hypothetical protein